MTRCVDYFLILNNQCYIKTNSQIFSLLSIFSLVFLFLLYLSFSFLLLIPIISFFYPPSSALSLSIYLLHYSISPTLVFLVFCYILIISSSFSFFFSSLFSISTLLIPILIYLYLFFVSYRLKRVSRSSQQFSLDIKN